MSSKERLNRIKSSALSRGLALAKVSMSAGARAASHAVGNIFANEDEKSDRLKEMLMSQVNLLARELGQLKGSLMKVGQMLSMYGEHFLPPEVNSLLKTLQSQSPPLHWNAIEKVIQKQFSPEVLEKLEIDPEPTASASLGQVHRARRKSDGRWLAMKIQYPGVDQAIEGDLKALRSILSVSKLIPKGPKYEDLFEEVRTMLHQEVDYSRELVTTQEFRERLAGDPRYIIPEPIAEFSTHRILTTTFEEGLAVDSPQVLALSQERRNAIGAAALDLYFKEIFEFRAVQTDPHFGNYRVRLGENGQPDRLVLLDFGAVRRLPQDFLNPYLDVVLGAHSRNRTRIEKGATELGFLQPTDTDEQRQIFVDLCYLITEPFFTPQTYGIFPDFFDSDGSYRFGDSDLPKRVAKKGTQFALAFKLRTPPREIVFLDRKLGGLFVFLSVLKVRFKPRDVIKKYVGDYPPRASS